MIGEGQRGATLECLLTKIRMQTRELNERERNKLNRSGHFSTATNYWYVSNISQYR